MASSSPMPMASRMAITSAPVRFSHVAHFVGLSLLRDPNGPRKPREVVKSASLPQVGIADDTGERATQSQSMESLSGVSTERVDKLRMSIGLLKAERRAEKEQIKKLQHSLSDCVVQEKKAHQRAQMQRSRRDEFAGQVKAVDHKIAQVKIEAEGRKLTRTWPSSSSPFGTPSKSDRPNSTGKAINAADLDASVPTSPKLAQNKADHVTQERAIVFGGEGSAEKTIARMKDARKTLDVGSFESDFELAQYRREVVRKELLAKAEKRADPSGRLLGGRAVTYFDLRKALIAQKLTEDQLQLIWHDLKAVEMRRDHTGNLLGGRHITFCEMFHALSDQDPTEEELQVCWDSLMPVEANNQLIEAFRLINLNGSGRICSQEFADGVERCGVQWKKLTGLKRPKHLFQLFDVDKDGVITLFQLFPSEKTKKKDDGGCTTPEFWKTWVNGNPAKHFSVDCPKGRPPPWNNGVAEDGLAVMRERDSKDAEAAFMRKWMQTTMRRMKGRGKSDARCREMCSLHLPRGTGPVDRQGVPTFSDAEVKQCRREYTDAMQDPQRVIQKELYELRDIRRELSVSRHKLWVVAMEPILKQQALEEQKNIAKNALGGMHLGIHHEAEKAEPEKEESKEPHIDDGLGDLLHGMTPF